MARVIPDSVKSDYPPMVGIRNPGDYVKGKVLAFETTKKGNPAVTLQLIDLQGSTTKSTAKGEYTEVDVNIGDPVQLVGSVKQLKEKLPQLQIGDIVTVKYLQKIPIEGGKTFKQFHVEVED